MQSLSKKEFQNLIIKWQKEHGRNKLPWQENPTPYRVLVSEVMLQQTQVTTVIPYFLNWMNHYPTIFDLAAADEDEVMAKWQGLGYYSRARNLRKAAKYICQNKKGAFPKTIDELCKVPGVGRYTAGAIASFAYNDYGPIVDGNVKRLFCRFFGVDGLTTETATIKKLWRLAEKFTPKENNRIFAQGLLDLGATQCKPKKPNCKACPLQKNCIAFQKNRVHELPTPKPKKVIPTREAHFLWVEEKEQLYLEKRTSQAVWKGLWCLPEIKEVDKTRQSKGTFKHTFTHYKLRAFVWIGKKNDLSPENQAFSIQQQQEIGIPTPIRHFIHKNNG